MILHEGQMFSHTKSYIIMIYKSVLDDKFKAWAACEQTNNLYNVQVTKCSNSMDKKAICEQLPLHATKNKMQT